MDIDGSKRVFDGLGPTTSSSNDNGTKIQKVCLNWRAGNCTKHSCNYLHSELPGAPVNGESVSSKWPYGSRPTVNKLCNYWIQGKCRYGDKCRYLHEGSSGDSFQLLTKPEGHQNVGSSQLDNAVVETPPPFPRKEESAQLQESSATLSDSHPAAKKKKKRKAVDDPRQKSKKGKKKQSQVASLAALVSKLPIPERGDEALDPQAIAELDDVELGQLGTQILFAGLALSSSGTYFGHEAIRRLGRSSSDTEKLKEEVKELRKRNTDLQAKVNAHDTELPKLGQEHHQEQLQNQDAEHKASLQEMEKQMAELKKVIQNHPAEIQAAVDKAMSEFKASEELGGNLSNLLAQWVR